MEERRTVESSHCVGPRNAVLHCVGERNGWIKFAPEIGLNVTMRARPKFVEESVTVKGSGMLKIPLDEQIVIFRKSSGNVPVVS
jgi:hypothetical protein